jgi:hypothetical protein
VDNTALDRAAASGCRQLSGNYRADAALHKQHASQQMVPAPMVPKRRRKSDTKQTEEDKLDDALEDSFPASDPVSFIEPAPKEPNDTPLDKERERSR